MSAYTKGPWRTTEIYTPSLSVIDAGGFRIADAEQTAILENYAGILGIKHWADSSEASRELSDEECEANARLMAAAPELFEALDDLLEAIPRQTDDADWWPDELTHAVRAARAAISKAEAK